MVDSFLTDKEASLEDVCPSVMSSRFRFFMSIYLKNILCQFLMDESLLLGSAPIDYGNVPKQYSIIIQGRKME